MDFTLYLLIGAFAGLTAAMIIDGQGLGPLGDIVFGTLGGLGAGLFYSRHGAEALGVGGDVIVSLVGAIGLLLAANAVRLAMDAHRRRTQRHHTHT